MPLHDILMTHFDGDEKRVNEILDQIPKVLENTGTNSEKIEEIKLLLHFQGFTMEKAIELATTIVSMALGK